MDYKKILKLVSENLYCGIFIVNKYGNVVFYNNSINDLAGLQVESAIGKHVFEIFPRLTEETSTIIRTLKTGKSIQNYVQNYYNYNDKLVTILSSTIPIYEDEQLVGAVEIFSDVEKYNHIKHQTLSKKVVESAFYTLDDLKGSSKSKKNIINKIKKTAESRSPVLVYGETGTGKEIVVQCLHNESKRKNKPFIAQNCAAIPGTLFESILFGTKLGSFTGAKDSKGLIESADGGTLFLDEINSMDITLQSKLLRFLQEGQIRRVGENTIRKVDVRVIAAMNENPYEAIEKGRLRNDLFYRLNAINFSLPPLRENNNDIIELSLYFLDYFNVELKKDIKGFSEEVISFFKNYKWPGNVRELKHTIEHAINIAENSLIKINDLPEYIFANKSNIIQITDNSNRAENIYFGPLNEQVEQFERTVILSALKQNEYNISKTANCLEIPRQTLYYKMDKLSIRLDKNAE